MSTAKSVSVVLATYARPEALRRLLSELAAQSDRDFEVIVVDDGSPEDVRSLCATFADQLALRVERKANGGAAAARQRGAELATGRILLFLDDDMSVGPGFVAAHAAHHAGNDEKVVLGRLDAPATSERLPLFERFFAQMLERLAEGARSGREPVSGAALYTGNVSLPRALFFRAGGFDPSFRALEDTELGVRLAAAGATFALADDAASTHHSENASVEGWMRRAHRDGVFATRVAKKHRFVPDASPYRHLERVSKLSRPLLALALGAPRAAAPVARAAMSAAQVLDALKLERLALAGATFVYGLQFYRGVAEEAGSLEEVLRGHAELREGLRRLRHTRDAAFDAFLFAVLADHEALLRSQARYGGEGRARRGLLGDSVQNAGFQLLVGCRFARLLDAWGLGLGAKLVTRVLRHTHGSDVHWSATLAPGLVLVHGFGLAIAADAVIGEGCILFQNVTLGRSLDGERGEAGAPRLERNVHVGVGATLVGPIVVGESSKIMAGCFLRTSVPARSLVEAPAPLVRPRG